MPWTTIWTTKPKGVEKKKAWLEIALNKKKEFISAELFIEHKAPRSGRSYLESIDLTAAELLELFSSSPKGFINALAKAAIGSASSTTLNKD